ncbi:hypothetical protein F4821DRAFT_234301 [Hypoxylon rubiginosum]|uniref:Uncharacterized protein n=1 Tax=Hypoxylon rubiginosum TaxID=110542 RepID=A0ACC0D6L4_9PEZI|nr:hypothetical protein F4821DRAFT_234301 [Hypoxylon rubiginosum]
MSHRILIACAWLMEGWCGDGASWDSQVKAREGVGVLGYTRRGNLADHRISTGFDSRSDCTPVENIPVRMVGRRG